MLQKYSLTQVMILHSLWNCKNCIKIGKTQKGVVWEAKHKTLHVWNNYLKLALKYVTRCATCYHLYNLQRILPLYYDFTTILPILLLQNTTIMHYDYVTVILIHNKDVFTIYFPLSITRTNQYKYHYYVQELLYYLLTETIILLLLKSYYYY